MSREEIPRPSSGVSLESEEARALNEAAGRLVDLIDFAPNPAADQWHAGVRPEEAEKAGGDFLREVLALRGWRTVKEALDEQSGIRFTEDNRVNRLRVQRLTDFLERQGITEEVLRESIASEPPRVEPTGIREEAQPATKELMTPKKPISIEVAIIARRRYEQEEKERKQRAERAVEQKRRMKQQKQAMEKAALRAELRTEAKKWRKIVQNALYKLINADIAEGRMEGSFFYYETINLEDRSVVWKGGTKRSFGGFWSGKPRRGYTQYYSVHLFEDHIRVGDLIVGDLINVPLTEEDLKQALVKAYEYGPERTDWGDWGEWWDRSDDRASGSGP